MGDEEQSQIEPAQSSEQPGTPIEKSSYSDPIQPAEPSEKTGTSIQGDEN